MSPCINPASNASECLHNDACQGLQINTQEIKMSGVSVVINIYSLCGSITQNNDLSHELMALVTLTLCKY